jgi:3-deoxy-D-manno-octulosonic-acid transferase
MLRLFTNGHKENAQQFLDLIHPEMVFFIKYEYWPNYLNELKTQHKTYLNFRDFKKTKLFLNGTAVL